MHNIIRFERQRYNMSLSDLAYQVGVTAQTIFDWENGRIEPKASQIARLARVFCCTSDYLLGLSNSRKACRH